MRDVIIKLLENKDFVEKIITVENTEEVRKLFKENGIEIDDSELDELGSVMSEIIEILDKMPEDELNSVSGGAELRSINILGADLIRKAVGYEPAQYDDNITEYTKGYINKEHFKVIKLLSEEQPTDSSFKNFVGKNANEIALGTIVAAGTAAIIGGAYGAKRLVSWYKKNHRKR